jgi:hypothetical protein
MTVQPSLSEREPDKPKPVTVLVNNQPVQLPDRDTTGADIKQAAGLPLDFKLYDPNGDEIGNEYELKVHPNEKFTAISGQDVS